MRFTTGWARRVCRSEKDWTNWLSSLKEGDDVLFQQFIPRGKSCLDSQIECWRFWLARFRGSTVFYDKDSHPLKDGRSVYWNSDSLHGDVFGGRIVPIHSDVKPYEGFRFADCHAPIFEPLWDNADRCFVRVNYGPNKHRIIKEIKTQFPQSYGREVYDGELLTVFADSTNVENFCKDWRSSEEKPVFLYAEATWD